MFRRKKILSLTLLFIFCVLPAVAWGATYYVKDDGNNGNTGLSDAQAWLTVAYAISQLSASDNLYFKCDDTWTSQAMTITDANVTIGAYNGDGIPGVSGAKPKLDGNFTVPASTTGYLLHINAPGVTVQDLHIYHSNGHGIYQNTYGVTVKRCDFTNNYQCACKFGSGSTGGIFENNYATRNCQYTQDQYELGIYTLGPQALNVSQSHSSIVRNNYFFENYGEAIGVGYDSLVEYNLMVNNRVGLLANGYADGATMRYNKIVGFPAHPLSAQISAGAGIYIGSESNQPIWTSMYIYGNIIVANTYGISWINQHTEADTNSAYRCSGLRFYHNTLIDNTYNFRVSRSIRWADQIIKNNLSIVYDIANCGQVVAYNSLVWSGWTIGPNHWGTVAGSHPEEPNWDAGINDERSDPTLPKSSNWRTIADLDGFSFADFYPPSDSTAVDNAKVDNTIPFTDYLTTGTDFEALPSTATFVTISQNDYPPGEDDKWDFGAVVYKSSGGTPPSAAEETCTGDCFFASSWEAGDGVTNSLHTYVWDGSNGNVTLDTSSFFDDGSCITWDSDLDYVYEGGALNKTVIYARGAFQITTGPADGEWNALFGFYDDVTSNFGYMRLQFNDPNYYVVGRVYDNDDSRWEYISPNANPDSTLPTGLPALSTNVEYQAEIYMNVTTEACGFRIWDHTGTLIFPLTGDWCEMTDGSFTGDDIDTIFAGNYTAYGGGGDVDQVKFSTSAIGFSTKIGGTPGIIEIGTCTIVDNLVVPSPNSTYTVTTPGSPAWKLYAKLTERLGPYATPDPTDARVLCGPGATDTTDWPYFGHLPDADGNYYLVWTPIFIAKMRVTHIQLYGATAADWLILNDAVLEDGDGNPLDLTYATVDIDGTGTITIAVYDTFTLRTDGDYATWDAFVAATYSVPGDIFDVDFTGDLDTDQSGTKKNPITISGTITGNATFDEDYWHIIDLDVSGLFKITGKYVEVE